MITKKARANDARRFAIFVRDRDETLPKNLVAWRQLVPTLFDSTKKAADLFCDQAPEQVRLEAQEAGGNWLVREVAA
jgi:hypothetical protein